MTGNERSNIHVLETCVPGSHIGNADDGLHANFTMYTPEMYIKEEYDSEDDLKASSTTMCGSTKAPCGDGEVASGKIQATYDDTEDDGDDVIPDDTYFRNGFHGTQIVPQHALHCTAPEGSVYQRDSNMPERSPLKVLADPFGDFVSVTKLESSPVQPAEPNTAIRDTDTISSANQADASFSLLDPIPLGPTMQVSRPDLASELPTPISVQNKTKRRKAESTPSGITKKNRYGKSEGSSIKLKDKVRPGSQGSLRRSQRPVKQSMKSKARATL